MRAGKEAGETKITVTHLQDDPKQLSTDSAKEAGGGGDRMAGGKGAQKRKYRAAGMLGDGLVPETPGMLCPVPPEECGSNAHVIFLSPNQGKLRGQDPVLSFPTAPRPGTCSSATWLLRWKG